MKYLSVLRKVKKNKAIQWDLLTGERDQCKGYMGGQQRKHPKLSQYLALYVYQLLEAGGGRVASVFTVHVGEKPAKTQTSLTGQIVIWSECLTLILKDVSSNPLHRQNSVP